MSANSLSKHYPLPTRCPLPTERLRDVLLGLVLIVSCGCQPTVSPSTGESQQKPSQDPINHSDAESPRGEVNAETAPRFPWESWSAYYIDGEHVGFNHLRAELVSINNQPHVRYRMEDQITIRRGSAKLVQHIQQECVEQRNGQPVRLETTVRIGSDTTHFRGRMDDGSFLIETTRGEETTARKIAWQDDFFGPHAVEQYLRDNPLERGGQHTVQTLMPVQSMVGRNELHAISDEVTDLRNGTSLRLLKVENRLVIGEDQSVTSYAWIDAFGRTIKLAIPSLKLTAYRTNRTAATAAVDPQRDVVANTFVPLSRRIQEPKKLKEAVYRITFTEDATSQTLDFPELPGQTVARQRDGSLRLTVRSGVHRLRSAAWSRPQAADLMPGPLIDHDAASVQALTEKAIPGQPPDAHATALQLTRFVHQYVGQKDFSRAFARASQVAEEAVGDCTEHAVLLAALLRDQQIPARVAAGLVYLDTADGPMMGYHMWTLAFVNGGWVALDATLGTGLAPADRLTILTSDLASGNEYEYLIPVLSVLGQFRIEVVASGDFGIMLEPSLTPNIPAPFPTFMPIIEVSQLTKSYRVYQKREGLLESVRGLFNREYRDVEAVRGIDLEVEAGEFVAFLGPNGAGKTTTLKLLSGVINPTSGSATVMGHVPWERANAYRRRFALVMGQKNQLWWDLPARESYRLHQQIYGIDPHAFDRRLDELTSLLSVQRLLDQPVRELSLGERMKMELIAAMLHSPEVLFLDEPTIGLDVIAQHNIQQFLKYYQEERKITILLTSHYMKDVAALCKRVVIIAAGRIHYDGSLSGVIDQFSGSKVVTLQFAEGVEPNDLSRIGEVMETQWPKARLRIARADVPNRLATALREYVIEDVAVEDPPLEDVIAALFNEVDSPLRDSVSPPSSASQVAR